MSDVLTDEQFWSDAWERHMEAYLAAPPRCGFWLESRFPPQCSVIEIGGGSCRDSRYLASIWRRSVGVDFDEKTIEYLRERFPSTDHEIECQDAFNLKFEDDSFDVSFSNGFWILFSDDNALMKLAREQARVTSKWMVVVVQNGLNQNLRATFKRKAADDALYDVRFFEPSEVEGLIRSSDIPIRSISLEKFGGRIDALYRESIKHIPNPLMKVANVIVPRIYQFQYWGHTERIACVVELDK